MRGLGLGLGLMTARAEPALVPVWTDDNVSDWAPVNVTLAVSAFTDPEVAAFGVAVRETAVTDNHYIAKDIPVVNGGRYRLRFLVKTTLRNTISINVPGKYWIGFIGSTTPDLADGFDSMTVGAAGSFVVLSVEFVHAGATGDISLSISTCLPGPSTFFLGETNKGFEFGNFKLFRVS